MQNIWKTDAETVLKFFEIVKEVEEKYDMILNREQRELIFALIMKQKGLKPCVTEMTKEEILAQLANHGTILDIDKNGNFTFIKKKK